MRMLACAVLLMTSTGAMCAQVEQPPEMAPSGPVLLIGNKGEEV